MSPALNRSSVIQYFEGSDALEICDGITFNSHMGLQHIHAVLESLTSPREVVCLGDV